MAVYKVPQDVEADDKLIGPFSFRQFIYLIVVAIGIALAWFLGKIFIGLILIPLPFILFFGALALPLRKDQPMEIYLVAVVQFYFKPRLRLWQPEGQVNLVTITVPHTEETSLTKNFTSDEAQARLAYLSDVIDTQGWAARGVNVSDTAMASLNDNVTAEASTIDDMLDDTIGIGRQFNSLIEEQDEIRKQQITQNFQTAMSQPQQASSTAALPPQYQPFESTSTGSNPLPPPPPGAPADISSYQMSATTPHSAASYVRAPQPLTEQAQTQVTVPVANTSRNASDLPPSPDIMNLANNHNLSISGIANEARRLQEDNAEVVIKLH